MTLERLPGLATVSAHWQKLLRDDFFRVARLIVPEPVLASSYPRLDGEGGPFTVVEHSAGDFVGVCEEDNARITLTEQDLVVYRIDLRRLIGAIAAAIEVAPDGEPLGTVPDTYTVGLYRPVAGFFFPAHPNRAT